MRKDNLLYQRRENLTQALIKLGPCLDAARKYPQQAVLRQVSFGGFEIQLYSDSGCNICLTAMDKQLRRGMGYHAWIGSFHMVKELTTDSVIPYWDYTAKDLSLFEKGLDRLIRNWPEVYVTIRDFPLRKGEHLYYWLLRTPSEHQREWAADCRFQRLALESPTIRRLRELRPEQLSSVLSELNVGIDPANGKDLTVVNGVLLPNKE